MARSARVDQLTLAGDEPDDAGQDRVADENDKTDAKGQDEDGWVVLAAVDDEANSEKGEEGDGNEPGEALGWGSTRLLPRRSC